jgi:mono/diheme cytochrome c family protein
MNTIKTVFLTLVGAAVVTAACAWAYMHSGHYDVAADRPENPNIASLLSMTSDQSVTWHAQGIAAPAITDPAMIKKGFTIYRDDCFKCHGAPGKYPTELSSGMNPVPPRLWKSTGDMAPSEVFWVIKHGIKMTGMPSWEKIHKDNAIWDIVAFVKGPFAKLTPEAYAQMDQQAARQAATEKKDAGGDRDND